METGRFILYTLIIIVGCNIFGFFLSIVALHTNLFTEYRIQKRKMKANVFYTRLPLILFNILLLVLISSLGLYYLYPIIFSNLLEFNFDVILMQLIIILLIDDFYFYLLHYWMHKNKFILDRIHRIHHRAITPLALDYMYVHPLEWILGYFGPFFALFLISLFTPVNILAFWSYQFIRNMHELDVHSGYKSFLSKWIPFWGESEHHDLHHAKLNGNYATTFLIWDNIFKTKIR